MAEEGPVFGCQVGFNQLDREIGILQLDAAFASVGVHDLPIAAAHYGGQRRFVFEEGFDIRQVARQQRPRRDEPGKPQADEDGAVFEPTVLTPIGAEPRERFARVTAYAVAEIV